MLTNGLKEIAGETLKKWLNHFTNGTFKSILTGMIMTIFVQSSTATTILTVGFVSAGLLTFMQSIGIIIGANIGSTSTGWIISLIGFKISLQAMALPIIGVGVFTQLLAPSNFKKVGGVLAGFGLLFLGIDLLQEGMGSAQEFISFESLSSNSIVSILLLILIGIVMTIIMQASSVAMATTLTALFTGAIDYEQAAYLVIGQNIGTTATALFASIGSSIAAKRTAMTHLLFNVITAIIVTIFCTYILQLSNFITVSISGQMDETLGLAIFNTLFSLLGAILFVPFIKPFTKLLERLLPEKENELTRNLDHNLVSIPTVALEVTYKTLQDIVKLLTRTILELIEEKKVTPSFEKSIAEVSEAIETTRKYMDSIQSQTAKIRHKHIHLIHALDHLTRLIKVLAESKKFVALKYQEKIMWRIHKLLIDTERSLQQDKIVEVADSLRIILSTNRIRIVGKNETNISNGLFLMKRN